MDHYLNNVKQRKTTQNNVKQRRVLSQIHSKKQNRLTAEQAKKLVYVHNQRKRANKVEQVGYQEATVEWEEWGKGAYKKADPDSDD